MAEDGKKKRIGADEEGNRRRSGRTPGPPRSEEEVKKKREEKNRKDREYRAKKTFERTEFEAFCEMPGINEMFKAFSEDYRKRNEESSEMQNLLKKYEGFCKEPRIIDELKAYSEKCRKRIEESTKKWQELFKKFFEEGVTEKFKAVCLKVKEEEERKINEEYKKFCEVWKNLEIEMIQTGGLEGVTDMNSSNFGAMGTPFDPEGKLKRKREEELDEELKTFTYDELGQRSIEELSLYDLQQEVTLDSSDLDTILNSLLEPEMFTGNLAVSSNVASGAANSAATGGGSE
ncbi:hypothetical protein SLE2022_397580 [Rubroshorea leprosula]